MNTKNYRVITSVVALGLLLFEGFHLEHVLVDLLPTGLVLGMLSLLFVGSMLSMTASLLMGYLTGWRPTKFLLDGTLWFVVNLEIGALIYSIASGV